MSYRDHLAHKMNVLRSLVASPHLPYQLRPNRQPSESLNMPNVGYVGLEHNQYSGYRIFEIINSQGGERSLCEGLKVHECINWINGAIAGLGGRIRMYGDADE